jgi:hypothetical protein
MVPQKQRDEVVGGPLLGVSDGLAEDDDDRSNCECQARDDCEPAFMRARVCHVSDPW